MTRLFYCAIGVSAAVLFGFAGSTFADDEPSGLIAKAGKSP